MTAGARARASRMTTGAAVIASASANDENC